MTDDPQLPIPDAADLVVILGAGRSVRGAQPAAMVDIDQRGRVMDWLLAAFGVLDKPHVCFVGGYKADEVVERYPTVRTVFNHAWSTTGPVHSLGLAPFGPGSGAEAYVCYADVVFRPSAVHALRAAPGEIVIAVDAQWRHRYDGRSRAAVEKAEKVRLAGARVLQIGTGVERADAEFAGVLRLTSEGRRLVASTIRAGVLPVDASLPHLLQHLIRSGVSLTAVDLAGEWAELDAPQDLARFVLGTKAESLSRLSRMNHGGVIGELVSFTLAEWRAGRQTVIDRVLSEIPGDELIVRSSALDEDSWGESGAGRYESVANVQRTAAAIEDAVERVFASYHDPSDGSQILIQEMLRDVVSSGVVMTRTSRAAPYYVLNFDGQGLRTDAATRGADVRTIFHHRGASPGANLPPSLTPVLLTVQRLERLVGHDSLDIEFAVTADDRVRILQVRPIALRHVKAPAVDDDVARMISRARLFVANREAPPPNLVGGTTRYSVMTDWNPAEIIGTKPKRLACSLYRHLITDDVWAQQRAEYGYRDVRPCPLLIDIAGHPYVDVRASFSSFVPAALPAALAGRLVDAYIARLAARPFLHDKVEFEVAFTCLTVDFEAQAAARLGTAGFSVREIAALRDALRAITEAGIARTPADLAGMPALDAAIDRLVASTLPPLDKAFQLLDLARRRGTLVFAHLARSAFVATSLLHSLQAAGALTADDRQRFLASIETVLSRMRADGGRVHRGEVTWETFIDIYGHLRPGTYDIASPSYRADTEHYLRPIVDGSRVGDRGHDAPEVWAGPARRAVTEAFRAAGLAVDADRFECFARSAIAGREEAKFIFTKALSAALDSLAAFGLEHGLDRGDLAHITIVDLLACRDVMSDPAAFLSARATEGKEAYHVSQSICLPAQIATADDLLCFEQEAAEPNFVTDRSVEGTVVAHRLSPGVDVKGRIVLIPSADPGYDWLLVRGVAALITMYGGANSHMAVRTAELGVPAAIGVGELLYAELEPARRIRLDCASRAISVLS